jgi:hypothetical protein
VHLLAAAAQQLHQARQTLRELQLELLLLVFARLLLLLLQVQLLGYCLSLICQELGQGRHVRLLLLAQLIDTAGILSQQHLQPAPLHAAHS